MNVRLHIDRLVLEGVPVSDRAQLAAAVESELARLIGTGGLGITEGMPSVRAPEIRLGPPLGASIAGAVYGALECGDASRRFGGAPPAQGKAATAVAALQRGTR